MVSYPFVEIKIEHECDPEPHALISLFDSIMTPRYQFFFPYSRVNVNLVSVHFEMKTPIFYNHISLIGKVREHQFFGLDPNFEPISTLIFEPRLYLSQIPKSVFAHIRLSSNQSSFTIALHCWTKVLNKMTQELFLKIKN